MKAVYEVSESVNRVVRTDDVPNLTATRPPQTYLRMISFYMPDEADAVSGL